MESKAQYPNLGHAILLAIEVVAFQAVLSVPLAIADLIFKTHLVGNFAVLGMINILVFGAILTQGRYLSRTPWRELFPLPPIKLSLIPPILLAAVGMQIVCSQFDNCLRYFVPPPRFLAEFFLAGIKDNLWGTVFLLVCVAPITEELLFRGLLLRGLLSRYKPWVAIAWSSFLFACVHLNPWQFILPILLGCLSAWYYVKTRSLVPCLLVHAFVNGIVALALGLVFTVQGFDSDPFGPVQFQPWWLDLSGLALLGLGIGLFARWCPPLPAAPAEPPVIEPPLLEPATITETVPASITASGMPLEIAPTASPGLPLPPTEPGLPM